MADPKTAEAIREEVIRRFEFESDRTKILDDKASSTMGFVGIITGIISGIGGFLLKKPLSLSMIQIIPLVIFFSDVICLILSFLFAWYAYRVRKYSIVPDAYYLIGAYEKKDHKTMLRDLCDQLAIAIEENMVSNNQKVKWIKRSMNALFLGVIFLFIFVLSIILL